MNLSELEHSLHTLNDEELFYQEYQQKKRDPRILNQFLKSLDVNDIKKRHLIVPEFSETMPPSTLLAANRENKNDLDVSKHNCYTPVFKHSHDFFEAFYVLEGSCHHEISDAAQTLYTGDFCIIPPGVEHAISVQDTSIVITMCITNERIANTFSNPDYHQKNILSEFFLKSIFIKGANDYLIFHTGYDENMRSVIMQLMLECKNRYPEHSQMLQSLTGIFFANLMRYYSKSVELPKFTDKSSSVAYGIVTFIQENLKTVTLKDVAEKFHYSQEHTSRFIKSATDMTFTELLHKYKIEYAEKLLKDTFLQVIDISYEIGYENPETFIRLFKKKNHCTPIEYRKQSQRL